MTTLTRNWAFRIAGGAGLVAFGLFAAVFFVPPDVEKAWVYTIGFMVAVLAVLLAAASRLSATHSRLGVRPRTRLGWWAVGLAAAGLVLAVALPATLMQLAATVEGPMVAASNVVVLGFLAAIAGGVVAAVAWFRRAERSVLVLLTMLPALFALYFLIGELVFPH
jgi:hypothetical protein